MCNSDGVNMGVWGEGFHQEVILELILKRSNLSDGKRHFRQASAEAGGGKTYSSGSCKVRLRSGYLWGDAWMRLERSWARSWRSGNLHMLRRAVDS